MDRLRCPVCRADFRGVPICPRCGADLEPLMRLAVLAHERERSACKALLEGNYLSAYGLARQASKLRATPLSCRIALLARWLHSRGER